MTAQVIDLHARRGPAPLIRTRPPEHIGTVTPFRQPCPSWCTRDDIHDQHLAATGAIAAGTEGRFDLITVLVEQQPRHTAVVDMRIQPSSGCIGALLDADALDELIDALAVARRCLPTASTAVRA